MKAGNSSISSIRPRDQFKNFCNANDSAANPIRLFWRNPTSGAFRDHFVTAQAFGK
jgi:hypothetical protein